MDWIRNAMTRTTTTATRRLPDLLPVLLASGLVACGNSGGAEPRSAPTAPVAPITPAPAPALPPVASLTDGVWMKGDLHIHSSYSTDSSNNPVSKIVALAQTVGMDYLGITDHDNHVQGDVANNTWKDADFLASPLVMLYGAEWTTVRGHGNTFAPRPYDHQRFFDARDELDTTLAKIKQEEGFHLSANHPDGNDHFGFSYDMVDSIEVWNSSIWSNNAGSLLIWQDMLNSGRDITVRGGSDSHHGYPELGQTPTQNSIQAGGNNVGTPTTWVFATARTAEAVIAALTNGRASVSSIPTAPRVELYADTNQDGVMDLMMGDNIASPGRPVNFRIDLVGVGAAVLPYTVNVIKNGGEFESFQVQATAPSVSFTDTPDATGRSYYRVEVQGQQALFAEVPAAAALSGNMIALSNPIYFNFRRPR